MKRYFNLHWYLLVILLVLISSVATTWADGCFVWNQGADLLEPSQKAVIYWADGQETLLMQVKYAGAAEDFAWIVPLPSRPEIEVIEPDQSPFAELSLFTQRRSSQATMGPDSAISVEVIEKKVVGVYEVAVLVSDNAGALNKWLNDNGYSFPKEHQDVLEYYSQKQWVYIAMRIHESALNIDTTKKLKAGTLQPIRFKFATDEMIYPLKISSVNSGYSDLLLYVLAEAPMVVRDAEQATKFSLSNSIYTTFPNSFIYEPYSFIKDYPTEDSFLYILSSWGKKVSEYSSKIIDYQYGTYRKVTSDDLPLTWQCLGLDRNESLSLCKYKSMYQPEEMTDDLTFTRFEPVEFWERYLDLMALSCVSCYIFFSCRFLGS